MKKRSGKDIKKTLDNFQPKIAFSKGMGKSASGNMFTLPMPFQPEFSDQSRLFYPIDRLQQNRYSRLYYKVDPVVGTVIDLFADIIASDFMIRGEGIDGEVKDFYEEMIDRTKIKSMFTYFIKEYIGIGEVIPHLILDKETKMWASIMIHNPDQINIVDSPFIAMDPIMEFVPDETLKKLVKSSHPEIQNFISKLPADLLGAISNGQNIPLDTTISVSFLARKLHPYDIRGTGILSRLYRILMYEDSIFNACCLEGTPVTLYNHTQIPIETVQVGDRVIDKDGSIQTVEAAWSERAKKRLKFTLQDGRIIECTLNHKYPVVNERGIEEKKEAQYITIKDCFLILKINSDSNKSFVSFDDLHYSSTISSVEEIVEDVTVYNLTVTGSHSYLANGICTYNSIATARRHSGPIKIASVGVPDIGNGLGPWIPEQEYEDKLLQLLATAEMDPHAFLVLPWFVKFEAFGTTDRMLTIGKENDVIERIKMTALGVSQGFIHGECFVGDTPILTSDYIYKPIKDIQVGESVIDKEGIPQIVTHAWKSHVPEKLVEIDLVGGKKLISTENHKFPVWTWMRECACGCKGSIKSGQFYKQGHHSRIKKALELIPVEAVAETDRPRLKGILKDYNPYQTLEASDIHKYDCLMIPRKFKEFISEGITLDHAKLLGFYIAEGCYVDASTEDPNDFVQWSFCLDEKETYAKEVIEAGKNLNMEFFSNDKVKGNVCSVRTARKEYLPFYQWLLSNGGKYSHGKQFSQEVMSWPLPYKEEVIRGMFKGDGSRSNFTKLDKRVNKKYKSFVVQYGTVSKILADQLQILLAQMGIYAVIDKVKKRSYTCKVTKKVYNKKDVYNLRCYGKAAQKLTKLVWNDDIHLPYTDRAQFWSDENYVYVPIKSIRTVDNMENLPVYNITVDNDHSYIANGFGSYNSTFASMRGNLQTLMMRLKGLRTYFENEWFYPKFFRPIAEMNEFHRTSKAQLSHKVRFRKSKLASAENNNLIMPKIHWSRGLDPKVDAELMDAYEQLTQRLGFKISKNTAFSAVGLDFEEEERNILLEKKKVKELERELGETIEDAPEGKGGGDSSLGRPSEIPTEEVPAGEVTPETPVPGASKQSHFAFEDTEVEDIVHLIQDGKVVPSTKRFLKKGEKGKDFKKNFVWERISEVLEDNDYSDSDILSLKKDLIERNVIEETPEDKIDKEIHKLVSKMTPESSDTMYNQIANLYAKKKAYLVSIGKIEEKPTESDAFLVGKGNLDKM